MSKAIRDLIKKISEQDGEMYSLVCKVKSINDDARTCVCSPLNGDADLLDVRLQASQSENEGFCIKPVVGSDVVVTFLSKQTAYVALYSDVEEMELVVNSQSFKMNAQGFDVNGRFGVFYQGADLKSAMSDLIDALTGLQILVTGTAGTVNPTSVTQLTLIKNKFNSFLK